MKLVRFGPAGEERPGVWMRDGRILDVSEVVEDYGSEFFAAAGLARLQRWVASEGDNARFVPPGVRLGPCIARPGKIVCIGLNYRDHAEESGMEPPSEPVVFLKAPNTLNGAHDDVLIPAGGEKTDWELELGVVIGAQARYLPDPSMAESVIAGYCVSNDVSERAFQLERGGQWDKGKSCETFNPLGPWLVTADEVDNVQALGMSLTVNDEVMQNGTTANMIFPVDYLVWYLTQFMVLEPGDVINTGTPAGVGMGRRPPRYLRPGDVVQATIEGLGEQRFSCRSAAVDARLPGGVTRAPAPLGEPLLEVGNVQTARRQS